MGALIVAAFFIAAWMVRPAPPLAPGTEVVLVGDSPGDRNVMVMWPREPGQEPKFGYASPGDRAIVLKDYGGGLNVDVRIEGFSGPVSVLPKNLAPIR